jgi:hypothetical protein
MSLSRVMVHCASALLMAAAGLSSAAATAAENDWMNRVGEALGKPGQEMPGGVYRVSLPRTDLKVTLDGVEIKPALALGSWLAFKKMGDHAMVMGDLVLTDTEINPVMKKLAEQNIEVTAIHNHLLRGTPNTMYMHVAGHGDAVKLAAALHSALKESKTPLEGGASGSSAPPQIELDTAAIESTIGRKGKINGGVFQLSIPRAEAIKDQGVEVPEPMGSAIAINFQPTGGGKAAITGDFVLAADEVNPVLRTLRENGIEVTALHNHMLDDQPRMFFMHFWANDDAQKLAKGLKSALDKLKLAPG